MGVTVSRGLSIRSKLLGVVTFLILVSVGVGLIAFLGFSRSNTVLDGITNHFIPELALIDDTDYQVARARRYEKEFFLFSSIEKTDHVLKKQQGYHQKLEDRYQIIGTKIAELRQLETAVVSAEGGPVVPWAGDPKSLEMVSSIETAYQATIQSLSPLTEKLLAGKTFLEVAETYAIYKKNVHDLEDGVKAMRQNVLAHLDLEKAEVAQFRAFLTRTLLITALTVILVGIVVGLWVSKRIAKNMDRLADRLVEGIQVVGGGEFQELKVPANDEFARVAQVFNETMGRLQTYIQTDQQRKETENNLIQFLEIVSEAADGDLTLKAPVTADMFGSIADAYNMMVDSLSELMADTRHQAEEVGSETRRLLEIFRAMEGGAEAQATRVGEATGFVQKTATATEEIAQKATLAREASARVDEVTGKGNTQVVENIEGMQLIRLTVQTINKKMKSLSERLLEIGTITELISEIATRTTILAMNASIEASRAGEQGRGFLVISDEIKKLADKSAQATKQIGGIVKAIQTEAGEVTAALEEETKTVEQQTMLARETGAAFGDIERSISGLNAVVAEIFELSDNQKRFTADAVQSMEAVSKLSVQTRSMIKDSAQITTGLNSQSEVLLESMSRFRLSASDQELRKDGAITQPDEASELILDDLDDVWEPVSPN